MTNAEKVGEVLVSREEHITWKEISPTLMVGDSAPRKVAESIEEVARWVLQRSSSTRQGGVVMQR